MITPGRIKAFLDDLAAVCLKHGIELHEKIDVYHDRSWIEVRELGPDFGGVCLNDRELGSYVAGYSSGNDVASLDVSTITAHQRIALAKSLASARASLPTDTQPKED